jgi:endonuclease-3
VKGAGSISEAIRLLSARYASVPRHTCLDTVQELVLTILSQHTSDVNSLRAYKSLMGRFSSLEGVAKANLADIENAIHQGGLARVKAPRIKEVLNLIVELNGSLDLSFLRKMSVSEAKTWLRQLPGIGPKSAGIILSFGLGMPAMAVDTHIYRVVKRMGFIGPNVTVEKAHEILEAMVEPSEVLQFHMSFIAHGRQVCKARRPRCRECVVALGCPVRDMFLAQDSGFLSESLNEHTAHIPELSNTSFSGG